MPRNIRIKKLLLYLIIILLANLIFELLLESITSNEKNIIFRKFSKNENVLFLNPKIENLIVFLNDINASLVDVNVLKHLHYDNKSVIDESIFYSNRPLVFGILRNFNTNIVKEIFVSSIRFSNFFLEFYFLYLGKI